MVRLLIFAAIAAGVYWFVRSAGRGQAQIPSSLILGLALLYLLSPIDLVPDASLVGMLDDLIVLAAALWVQRQTRQRPPRDQPSRSAAGTAADKDPHEVLGIQPGASEQEIKDAYRDKMKRYHPDRVSGLGEELQRVATEKTLEIQRAYDKLRQSR
jgi:DnaJ like chaperone protein